MLWEVIVVLFIQFQIVYGAKKNLSYYDNIWKRKQTECKESSACKKFIPDEAMNCINSCTSEKCFNLLYIDEPLEDGEIDVDRQRKFTTCLRDEVKRKKLK